MQFARMTRGKMFCDHAHIGDKGRRLWMKNYFLACCIKNNNQLKGPVEKGDKSVFNKFGFYVAKPRSALTQYAAKILKHRASLFQFYRRDFKHR